MAWKNVKSRQQSTSYGTSTNSPSCKSSSAKSIAADFQQLKKKKWWNSRTNTSIVRYQLGNPWALPIRLKMRPKNMAPFPKDLASTWLIFLALLEKVISSIPPSMRTAQGINPGIFTQSLGGCFMICHAMTNMSHQLPIYFFKWSIQRFWNLSPSLEENNTYQHGKAQPYPHLLCQMWCC